LRPRRNVPDLVSAGPSQPSSSTEIVPIARIVSLPTADAIP
jgi:hypothetical protein